MKQKYSPASYQPLLDVVLRELEQLKGLPVLKWYRGMAHTLHLHLGKGQAETVSGHSGERVALTGAYSLFLHGEWQLSNGAAHISSVDSSSAEIDAFIHAHPLTTCKTVAIDKNQRTLTLSFVDGTVLAIFDRAGAWFVFEIFGQASFSPKNGSEVEVTQITLEK